MTAQRADEHQIRYVDTDDQQDGGDGDEQQQNRTPDQWISALVVERHRRRGELPAGPDGIRDCLVHDGSQSARLDVRLLQRHARLHPRDDGVGVIPFLREGVGGLVVRGTRSSACP